ncbi:MAG: sulfite exporter TauE/SafE family protein [Pararhodobacter sp.]
MPDPSFLALMVVMLAVIGAFAGVVAGLLGVGGGIVLVPAFFYAFTAMGYDGPQLMQVCLGTSLATIIVTSLKSARAHNKRGAVDWEILKGWAPWIAAGALVGVVAAAGMHSVMLQAIFGVLGLAVGLYLAFGREQWRLGSEMPKGVARRGTGSVIGFLSVLMGIGGGSFGVPLMALYSVPIHRAVATASGFGVVIAVPSVAGFLLMRPESPPPWTLGAVNLPAFALVVAMTLITTSWGVRLAHAMDPKPLKRVFAVFIMVMALNMLRKALGY